MQSGQTKYGTGMTAAACLWLGLFPLLQFGSYHTITHDKWVCMLILFGVTGICFLADVLRRRISGPRLLPLLAGGILLLWMLISCLASPYPAGTWWIGAGRREGLSSQLCYLGLFFLFSFSRVRRTPVLLSAGAGVSAFAVVVLLQRAGFNPLDLYPEGFSYSARPGFQGTIGNVDMDTGYLLILCGLFLPALTGAFRRLYGSRKQSARQNLPELAETLLFFLFLAVSVWLIVSMKVRFGLLTLAVLAVVTAVRFLPKKLRLAVLLLLLAAVLLIAWFIPGPGTVMRELHGLLRGDPDPGAGSGRLGLWLYSLKLLRQDGRFLLGSGADTFAPRFDAFLSSWLENHPEAEKLPAFYDSPHNEYLALVLNFGVPALLCFLVLLLCGYSGSLTWRDSVLCYAIQAFFSFSVCLVAPLFWAVLALSCTQKEESGSLRTLPGSFSVNT